MFAEYFIVIALLLIAGYFFCALLGWEIMVYILGFLLLVAVLAALATIVSKLGDLEERLDKLLEKKKDEHEE